MEALAVIFQKIVLTRAKGSKVQVQDLELVNDAHSSEAEIAYYGRGSWFGYHKRWVAECVLDVELVVFRLSTRWW